MTSINYTKLTYRLLPYLITALLVLIVVVPVLVGAQTPPTGTGGTPPAVSPPTGEASQVRQSQTWFESILWTIVSTVFGGLTWLAGGLLDYSILELVLNFGRLFQTSGLGLAVNTLWSLIRDIFNLTFIFGLIYIGFQLILNTSSSAARQAIVNLVIAALLINFSLFITKTVIDFSNILSVQIAQVIYRGGTGQNSISQSFGVQMGLSSIWGQTDAERQAARNREAGTGAPPNGLLYIFGSMIVFCVAAFSFATGAVLLFVRFIKLNFMMILSPLMFLFLIFPMFKGTSMNYIKSFFKECFFAPAFLLMLYFSLYILGNFNRMLIGNNSAAGALTSGIGLGGLAGLFIGAGFLIGSVMIANQMGATGASGAMKFGNSIANKARGYATGAAMLPVRGAQAGGRALGRTVGGTIAQPIGGAAKGLSNRLNTSLGKMAQGGWAAKKVARTLESTVGAGLKSAENASILGSETKAARLKRLGEQQTRFNAAAQAGTRSKTIKDELVIARDNAAGVDETQRNTRAGAMNKIAGQVRSMSNDEILSLDHATLKSPEFAQHLTDAHVTAIKTSGIYTNDQTKEITTSRDSATVTETAATLDSTNASATELNTALEQLTQTVQRIPIDRLQGFPVPEPGQPIPANSLLNERVATNLTDKQIEDLQNSGRFDAKQMQRIKGARTAGLTAIASGTAPTITNNSNPNHKAVIQKRRDRMLSGNDAAIGNLPLSILLEPSVVPKITPRMIEARMRSGAGIDAADKKQLNLALMGHWGAGGEPTEWTRWKRTPNGAEFFKP